MSGGLPNARWTPPENLHLTLRFIGEVTETLADDIDANLRTIKEAAFPLEIGGLGTFDAGRRAHHLWIGVRPSPALTHLQANVERAVVRAGVKSQRRRFLPHITLAKLKDSPRHRLEAFVVGHNLFQATLTVSSFTLFSSHLGHGDPLYRAERDYSLIGE